MYLRAKSIINQSNIIIDKIKTSLRQKSFCISEKMILFASHIVKSGRIWLLATTIKNAKTCLS